MPAPRTFQKLNYFAFMADRSNSYTYTAMTPREVGDEFLHSVGGKGIVVHCETVGPLMHKLIVRTDITLDQLIEKL